DKVSTPKHNVDHEIDDEPLPHLTAYDVDEPKESAPAHEYPIYMPQAKPDKPAEQAMVEPTPPQRKVTVNAAPVYSELEPQIQPIHTVNTDNVDPLLERTKQLNVTIEELEAAAQQADDWGTEEQAAPSFADAYSSYVESHTATDEPISVEPDYAQYEQFEAEQVQQPSIEHPVHEEPAIDSAVLDSI
ncbi:DNA translocase FtsK, partial [Vibrio parahaemolyticus]|nr:DNA translocase FtsK [Vibrio parahaemolyticus]NMS18022.1 DNA translocase FtsK [Vibrio parahaemolyticus]